MSTELDTVNYLTTDDGLIGFQVKDGRMMIFSYGPKRIDPPRPFCDVVPHHRVEEILMMFANLYQKQLKHSREILELLGHGDCES